MTSPTAKSKSNYIFLSDPSHVLCNARCRDLCYQVVVPFGSCAFRTLRLLFELSVRECCTMVGGVDVLKASRVCGRRSLAYFCRCLGGAGGTNSFRYEAWSRYAYVPEPPELWSGIDAMDNYWLGCSIYVVRPILTGVRIPAGFGRV